MTILNPEAREKLQLMLIEEEGMKLFPYKDSEGVLTIGVGRNIQQKGITKEESLYLLDNDISECEHQVAASLPLFFKLDMARRIALIDMCFNLGINGLLGFKKMLKALELSDYDLASQEMKASLWAKQVGFRSEKLSHIMKEGAL